MGHRTDHAEIDHVVVEMVDNEGIILAPTFRLSVPPNCECVVLYSILRNSEFWRLCLSCIYYFRFLLSLDDPLPVLCANSTFQRQPNCLQVKPGKNSKLLFRTPHSTGHNFDLIQFLSHIFFASNHIFYLFHLDSNDDLKCLSHVFSDLLVVTASILVLAFGSNGQVSLILYSHQPPWIKH